MGATSSRRPPPPHDTARLARLNSLLAQALALPEARRGAWLRALPTEHQALVPALAELLARASIETDQFLRTPLQLGGLDVGDDDGDQAGDVVGGYRLEAPLGSGGMASVWQAERADGLPRRRVALKLPHRGSPGLAQRMARERDLLAALEHPNIARLYDAGVTPDGRPWIAMECVDGEPIDAYCESHHLDTRERLRLFLQVADAVAHAHGRLVVHRDLKPANVLVTPAGQVRLLDFGVAALLDAPPAGRDLTQRLGRPVTPDYAAPEQLAGEAVGVAADVYSLGVLLYELLAGERPYRLDGARSPAQAVLDADVPPASSRVRGDRARVRALRGDLDAILDQALRKAPSLRYASVESFAADVRRHLEGRAVSARAPSRSERAWKFARRHRIALATWLLVSGGIAIGGGAALWQAHEARLAAERAGRVKTVVASVLRQATLRDGGGGIVTATTLLHAAAQRIETELAHEPRVAAELGTIVGEAYFSLGEIRRAQAVLEAAVERGRASLGASHPITLQARALQVESIGFDDLPRAERALDDLVPQAVAALPGSAAAAVYALRSRGYVQASLGRPEAAMADLRRAVEIGERELGANDVDTVRAIGLLGHFNGLYGERDEQLRLANETLSRARAIVGTTRPHRLLTSAERLVGEALVRQDRPRDALPMLRTVLADQQVLDGAESYRVLYARAALGGALAAAGELAEALPLLQSASELDERLHAVGANTREHYGAPWVDALLDAGRLAEAQAAWQRIGLRTDDEGAWPEAWRVARRQALEGRVEAARATLARAQGRAAADAQAQAGIAGEQAWLARAQGRADDALALTAPWLERPDLPVALRADLQALAAWARLDRGEHALARGLLDASEAGYAQAQVMPGVRTGIATMARVRWLIHRGDAAAALAAIEPLAAQWQALHPGSVWHGEALLWLARAQRLAGRSEEARAHRAQALAMLGVSPLAGLRREAARG